jgi:hypothetical protein
MARKRRSGEGSQEGTEGLVGQFRLETSIRLETPRGCAHEMSMRRKREMIGKLDKTGTKGPGAGE